MKKLISLLLVLVMAFSLFALVACGGESDTPDEGGNNQQTEPIDNGGDDTGRESHRIGQKELSLPYANLQI